MEVNPKTKWTTNYIAFFGPIDSKKQAAWMTIWGDNIHGDAVTADEMNAAVARLCARGKQFKKNPTCEDIFWEIVRGRTGKIKESDVCKMNESLSICRQTLAELPPCDRYYKLCDFIHQSAARNLPDNASGLLESFCEQIEGGLPSPSNDWNGDVGMQQRHWQIGQNTAAEYQKMMLEECGIQRYVHPPTIPHETKKSEAHNQLPLGAF